MKRTLSLFLFLALVLWSLSTAQAASKNSYEGKTVKIIAAAPPGGGFDAYARLFARHMGKHLPGNPKTIVVNIPGGSGVIAANYMYNIAKPDGATIAHASWGIAQMDYLGATGVKYDVNKFNWLGLANVSPITAAIRKDSPIQTAAQWLDPKTKPLIFGCTTRSSLTCSLPLALNQIFGPITKVVPGYQGTAPIRAGLLQGEVDGLTGWSWDSVKATGKGMLDDGSIKLIAYIGEKPNQELDDLKVPYLTPKITKPEDKAFMKILMMPAAMLRPWMAPPGTSKEKVALLRKAFQDTLKDPEFLKDAKRSRIEVNPETGEWLAAFIKNMKADVTPEVRNRARKIIGLQ